MSTVQTEATEGMSAPLTIRAADLPALLGVGRSTAYNLLKSGAIRSVRAGRRYVVPADAVTEFLKGAK